MAQLEILAKSTLKFHVVTPEFVYTNAAIVGYDLAREPDLTLGLYVASAISSLMAQW
ncbi:hypothetical protein [Xenorhabdus bovienii]|uniref:hypothetical protein n=1 Tax=Xenorhabdus bovienii TaxID=40576 RepID=UPI0023B33B0E|nr:hypothetical protein [Xenorhabdus bovienii]